MKYVFIALIVLLNPIGASAQKHSVFADVGYTPGFSVTYNYKLAKRLGAGVGLQGYRMHQTWEDTRNFTPALYGNIRLNMRPEKNNQFFLLLDLGMNLYKQDKTYYRDSISVFNIPRNNGIYSGLSFGYLRRMTKNGGGPYVSLKPIANWHTIRRYYLTTEERDGPWLAVSAVLVISLGFKF